MEVLVIIGRLPYQGDSMPVYRDLDQVTLDRLYNPRQHTPNASATIQGYTATSRDVAARFRCLRDLSYGDDPEEKLDLVLPDLPRNAPVLLFLHGGQWQLLSKDDSLFPAPPFTERGVIFAAASFGAVPKVPLETLVERSRRALGWLIANIGRHGGDPGRIVVAGHSSGAHLAAMIATTDASALRGIVLVSGLYDLEPVRLSYRNEILKLDEARAAALSPLRHLPATGCPAVVATAENDTSEFIRQGAEFANAWANRVARTTRLHVMGHNHYTLIETLADPTSPLGEAALALMASKA